MKPLSPATLRGTWGALLLPINADDSIDFDRLAEQVKAQTRAGLAGIYSNGSAGEFFNQTEDEFARIQALLATHCEAAGMPFQIGACHMDPRLTLQRIERTKELRPGAFQVILPDWFPCAEPDAIAFLERVARVADPIPLVLYNPPHAKRVFAPDALGRIARAVPGVIRFKVKSLDAAWFAAVREHVTSAAVFVPGHALATGIREGMHGSYSNVACLHPVAAQRWYEFIVHGDPSAARIEAALAGYIEKHLRPFVAQGFTNAAIDKAFAAVGGWAPLTPRMRWPLRGVPETEVPRLREAARSELTDFFALVEAVSGEV